jgi:hypothetical protein
VSNVLSPPTNGAAHKTATSTGVADVKTIAKVEGSTGMWISAKTTAARDHARRRDAEPGDAARPGHPRRSRAAVLPVRGRRQGLLGRCRQLRAQRPLHELRRPPDGRSHHHREAQADRRQPRPAVVRPHVLGVVRDERRHARRGRAREDHPRSQDDHGSELRRPTFDAELGPAGHSVYLDRANLKVKAFNGTTEIANATNLSAVVVRGIIEYGDDPASNV